MKNKSITLIYHSIGGADNREVGAGLYCVSVEKFREQMKYLARTVPFGDSPCITFDDGMLNNYTVAYPILKELGLKAYFFIIVSKVGTSGYMSWEQLKELKDAGMIIGSHGMGHKILVGLSNPELHYELGMSKRFLEFNLGYEVDYFSIPKGHYNKRVIDKIKEAGYKAVFTSDLKNTNDFTFGRIAVRGSWSIDYFSKVVSKGLSFKDRISEMAKGSAKRILSAKYYDSLRVKLLAR